MFRCNRDFSREGLGGAVGEEAGGWANRVAGVSVCREGHMGVDDLVVGDIQGGVVPVEADAVQAPHVAAVVVMTRIPVKRDVDDAPRQRSVLGPNIESVEPVSVAAISTKVDLVLEHRRRAVLTLTEVGRWGRVCRERRY